MKKHVCVIVPARNEAERLPKLLRSLQTWRRKPEVLVVANGCTDGTARVARRCGARVLEFDQPLGHDVGRAIGLAAVQADVYIVVDADIACRPIELEPFVAAVENGVDVALNRYPMPGTKAYFHPTSVTKRALNLFLDRRDLEAASLTAVPHAISRRAVEALGAEPFVVPPVAQSLAVLRGLTVKSVAHVPVGARNPMRALSHQLAMRRLILGDCLEAMHTIIQERGVRGGFTDLGRRRDLLTELTGSSTDGESRENGQNADWAFPSVAVVPVKNEAANIRVVVSRLRAGVGQVCVVSNGSNDGTPTLAQQFGARVEEFPDALGHDVGRAVGCITVPARRYLFTDGDFPLAKRDVRPFVRPTGKVDVALNHFDKVVPPQAQRDAVSVVKRFLNLAVDRADLGSASMTAVPHSIGRHVVDTIGAESLAVPPIAQVRAILAGFHVEAVHAVDVVKPNRFRVRLHSAQKGRPLERMIIGDHLEAVAVLLDRRGPRGGYEDTSRQRRMARLWLDEHGRGTVRKTGEN